MVLTLAHLSVHNSTQQLKSQDLYPIYTAQQSHILYVKYPYFEPHYGFLLFLPKLLAFQGILGVISCIF